MPALTLSPSQHTSTGTGHLQNSPYHRTQALQRGLRPPPTDPFSNHALYDSGTTSHLSPQYQQLSYIERVYPSPAHYFPTNVQTIPPSSAMFSYFATSPQISSTWQAHPSIAQSNPYPPLPPPPQLVHKVWILDCNSCGTFLTNRGMKAVLLLRPNVSLFSTDALPINCSAYTTNPDALRPSPCRPSTQVPSRTCECLTQTLCCHSCGSAVGYMIVIPCSRCTSSISATNRATNGHRFVFHSNEIKASERHYVSGEPGVIPYDVPVPSAAPALTHAYHQSPTHPTTQYNYSHPRNPQALPPQPTSSPPPQSEYLPTPPLELAELTPLSASSSSESLPFSFSRAASPYRSPRALPRSPPPLPPAAQVVPMSIPSQPASASSSPEPRGMPLEQREQTARKLKSGEVLFWHHLSRSGEIPGVQEDSRARVAKRNDGPTFFDR